MLKCKAATELISLSCEQKLNFKQQLQLKVHLMMCSRCRGFARNTQKVEQFMKTFDAATEKSGSN
ncbi:TPA: zf-HC2 domain-containing protein [Mannheimia haemolytica]